VGVLRTRPARVVLLPVSPGRPPVRGRPRRACGSTGAIPARVAVANVCGDRVLIDANRMEQVLPRPGVVTDHDLMLALGRALLLGRVRAVFIGVGVGHFVSAPSSWGWSYRFVRLGTTSRAHAVRSRRRARNQVKRASTARYCRCREAGE